MLGTYGVDAILEQRRHPQGAHRRRAVGERSGRGVGRREVLRERFGIEPIAVTGPATDNAVGVEIIQEQLERAGVQRAERRRGAGRLRSSSRRPHAGARRSSARRTNDDER